MAEEYDKEPDDEETAKKGNSDRNSTDDDRDYYHRLRREQKELQRRMKDLERDLEEFEDEEATRPGHLEIKLDETLEHLGQTLEGYLSDIIGSVTEGIEGAIEGVFSLGNGTEGRKRRRRERLSKRKERIRRKDRRKPYRMTEEDKEAFPKEGASLLGVLSDENRLRILKALESGGEYQKELSETTGVKGGQWKHHTDLLREAGFIEQEARRGKYLLTIPGREALKLAEIFYSRKKSREKRYQEEKKERTRDSEGSNSFRERENEY